MRVFVVSMVLLASASASAQRWQDATAQCIGTTAEWTNKVEVADVDGDGHVDILLANGGDYNTKGTAEPVRIWKNLANWSASGAHCQEITTDIAGTFSGNSRTIKAADIDGDGDLDILTAGAYQTQAKLFRRDAAGWTDVTAQQLPLQNTSIGDAELGDIDGDGDLDIVIADWGAGNPATVQSGRVKLYRNDGQGTFVDESAANMPDIAVRWSWDIELSDIDGDFDLDVLVAVKSGTTSLVFKNDGNGHFTNEADALPHFGNNYEFEPMDIDGDGDLDLLTINDGPNVTEHVFVNRVDGTFIDETSTRLTGAANPANEDDNTMVWLDVDNDGDSDVLIGSLGTERLLLNDGHGVFTLSAMATPNDTPATLGLGIADLDEDGRLDLVQGQGESAFPDKVQLGGAMVSFDTQPPVIMGISEIRGHSILARIHDRVGPSHAHDFTKVVIKLGAKEIPMRWVGPMLWSGALSLEDGLPATYQVCATDRAGNEGCKNYMLTGDADAGVNADGGNTGGSGGGCCDASRDARGSFVLALVVLTSLGTRRRRSASR